MKLPRVIRPLAIIKSNDRGATKPPIIAGLEPMPEYRGVVETSRDRQGAVGVLAAQHVTCPLADPCGSFSTIIRYTQSRHGA